MSKIIHGYYDLGIDCFKKGLYNEAIEEFDNGIKQCSLWMSGLLYEKANCLSHEERHEEAIAELEKILSLAIEDIIEADLMCRIYTLFGYEYKRKNLKDRDVAKSLYYFNLAEETLKFIGDENNEKIVLVDLIRKGKSKAEKEVSK